MEAADGSIRITADLDTSNLVSGLQELSKGFEETCGNLSKSIEDIKSGIGSIETGIGAFGEGVDSVESGFDSIQTGVEAISDGFGEGFGSGLDAVVENIGEISEGFDSFEKGFNSFQSAVDTITGGIESVESGFEAGSEVVGVIGEVNSAISDGTAVKMAETVAQDAMTASTAVWEGICTAAAGVTAAFGAAMEFLLSPVGLIVIGIVALIAAAVLLVQNWDTVKEKAIEIWTAISDFLTGLWETITETATEAWQPISDFILGLWTGIGESASEIWEGIQEVWATVAQWFTDNVITPVITAFENLRDGVKKAWEDLWTGIKTIINHCILTGIESFINFIISGFNKLISLLNTLQIKAPQWITNMTGITSFGFHLTPLDNVAIPRLAQGAVIPPNRRFVAVLGDQTGGTNIETPLNTMVEAFRTALSQMGGAASGNLTVTVPVYLDSEKIYEGQRSVQLRRGTSIVKAGVTA
jgi:phage-related protein